MKDSPNRGKMPLSRADYRLDTVQNERIMQV